MNTKYYYEGVEDSKKGVDNCKYDPGSHEFTEWMKGWEDQSFEIYLDHSKEYHEGFISGILEDSQSNPYEDETKEWEDWNLGHTEGSNDLIFWGAQPPFLSVKEELIE